jgi:putative ABC transport system permease protein
MTKKAHRPQRFTRWILSRMRRYNEEFLWAGDIEEEFKERATKKGIRRARCWYRRQVLKTIPSYIKYFIKWSLIMFRHYTITAWRYVKRQKIYSIINIVGLALGITFFILIMLYIQYELSFDRYNHNARLIYRVAKELPPGHTHGGKTMMVNTTPPLAPTLMAEFPEVESAARFCRRRNILLTHEKNHFLEEEIFFTDPQVFDIFSISLVAGNPQTALADPYSIILSQKTATKYFGSENPFGKILRCGDSLELKVTGILKNMPQNSHFIMDIIVPFETLGTISNLDLNSWQNNFCATYLLMAEGSHPDVLESKIPELYRKYANPENWPGGRRYARPFLQSLTMIHLHSDLDGELAPNNDIKNIYLFSTIALLILIIACINYMNLTTACSAQRGKEVAVRKVVGAQRHQLIKQFYGESMIFTLIALAASLVLICFLLPAFNAFVERDLSLSLLNNPVLILGVILVVAFVGLLSGSYPALLISSFLPVFGLKRQILRGKRGRVLRNTLVIFQFAVSIGLIICALVVQQQLGFIKNQEVGYDKDQIVVIRLHDQNVKKRLDALKSELKANPDVMAVTATDTLPNNIQSEIGPKWPGMPEDYGFFDIYISYVDEEYLDVYGMDLVQGRNFSQGFPSDTQSAFIFNEALVKALEWEQPLGREFQNWDGETGRIVGVVKDFNFHSLHRHIDPMCLYYRKDQRWIYYLSAKIRGDHIPETLGFMEKTWKTFSPAYPFDYSFFDDIFDRAYRSEHRLGNMFRVFSMLAVVIACLGLFGLAAFTAEQRTKEIGVRKVLGATQKSIFMLLSKEFTKWVLIANFFAWPIAYLAMNKWLQSFAYRAPLAPWIFALATALTMAVALGTVTMQTAKVASTNPVEVLRYE